MFMHISDIDGEYIPRKGDKVKFRLCPMPPKFDKFQAVHIQIVDFVPEVHHKWVDKVRSSRGGEKRPFSCLPFIVQLVCRQPYNWYIH